ncbi:MAG: LEA type 2 family protein [Thiotrichales bacterium]|nr:MAG: LEA type 2 family protein [Thiotrichales bacterium]
MFAPTALVVINIRLPKTTKMKIFQSQIILLLFVFVLSGCAELAKHAESVKPTARLVDTRLASIDFKQADLVFDLEIDNQNPFAINLAGLDYDLTIENHSLLSGVAAQGLVIKPASTSTVELPVTLKFDDLSKLPGELWKQDRFSYRLDTKFVVDLPVIGNYAIPVNKTGELPVPKLPDISLKGIQVRNVGLKSAELVAQVEIDNPNSFDLSFSNFDYQLNVNQAKWGQGSIRQGGSIPQKGSSTVEIPVKLDLMSMGQTAYKLLTSKQPVEYQLKGGITLDTGIEMFRNYSMPLDISGKASLFQ